MQNRLWDVILCTFVEETISMLVKDHFSELYVSDKTRLIYP